MTSQPSEPTEPEFSNLAESLMRRRLKLAHLNLLILAVPVAAVVLFYRVGRTDREFVTQEVAQQTGAIRVQVEAIAPQAAEGYSRLQSLESEIKRANEVLFPAAGRPLGEVLAQQATKASALGESLTLLDRQVAELKVAADNATKAQDQAAAERLLFKQRLQSIEGRLSEREKAAPELAHRADVEASKAQEGIGGLNARINAIDGWTKSADSRVGRLEERAAAMEGNDTSDRARLSDLERQLAQQVENLEIRIGKLERKESSFVPIKERSKESFEELGMTLSVGTVETTRNPGGQEIALLRSLKAQKGDEVVFQATPTAPIELGKVYTFTSGQCSYRLLIRLLSKWPGPFRDKLGVTLEDTCAK
jgi:chaperonin cofactor prefoldin